MKCFKEHMKLCMLTLMCILFLGVGIRAEAAPEKVTGFRQEDGNDTIAVVQWDYISEEYEYRLEWCDRQDFVGASSIQCGNSACMITDLTPGSTYYVRVFAVDKDGKEGEPSPVIEVVTAPEAMEGIWQTGASEKEISFSWENIAGATGYRIIYQKVDGQGKKQDEEKYAFAKANENSLSLSNAAGSYEIAVYPIRECSTGYVAWGESETVTMSVLPGKVTSVKTETKVIYSASGKTFWGFSMNLSDGAEGCEYELFGSNGKRVLKKSVAARDLQSVYDKNGKATSKKEVLISAGKIKKGQFMKVRIRGYIEIDGKKKAGKWSDYCYFAEGPQKVKSEAGTRQRKLSWSPVKGANSYTIYTAKSPNSKWKKVGTTSKTRYTAKYASAASKGKVYCKVVANKKVEGKTFTGMPDGYISWSW